MKSITLFSSILISLVLGTKNEKSSTSTSHIIGGEIAPKRRFSYQISYQHYTSDWRHVCGGGILSEKWAITAAHCLISVGPHRIVAGTVKYDDLTDTDRQERNVQDFFIHPNFQRKYVNNSTIVTNDLMLLKLSESLTFNSAVNPALLPVNSSDYPSEEVIVAGWGVIFWWLPLHSLSLEYIRVPIVPFQQCRDLLLLKLGVYEEVDPCMICTGKYRIHRQTCQGDSGNPLVQEILTLNVTYYKIYGITSWGFFPCVESNDISIYSNVAAQIEWINAIMEDF